MQCKLAHDGAPRDTRLAEAVGNTYRCKKELKLLLLEPGRNVVVAAHGLENSLQPAPHFLRFL